MTNTWIEIRRYINRIKTRVVVGKPRGCRTGYLICTVRGFLTTTEALKFEWTLLYSKKYRMYEKVHMSIKIKDLFPKLAEMKKKSPHLYFIKDN